MFCDVERNNKYVRIREYLLHVEAQIKIDRHNGDDAERADVYK